VEAGPTVEKAPQASRPVPFWRPVAVELSPSESEGLGMESEQPERTGEELRESDLEPPPDAERRSPDPIVAWPRLWRALDDRLRTRTPRSEIDVGVLVERWARGESVERLPRLAGLVHARVVLILDQSPPLMPFRIDQMGLAGELLRRLGPASVRLVVVRGTEADPFVAAPDERVLALTDLGSYGDRERVIFWERLGERLRRAKASSLALVPCPPARWPRRAASLWSALEWSAPDAGRKQAPDDRPDPVELLLRLASPAVRLEIGLLRDLRRLVAGADVDTEADLWLQDAVAARSIRGLSLEPEEARRRLESFVELPEATQKAVIEVLRSWHESLAPEVWAEEVIGLVAHGVPEKWLGAETVEQATVLIEKISATVERGRGEGLASETEAWFDRFTGRASRPVWAHRRFRRPLGRAMAALRSRQEDATPPSGMTPEMFLPSLDRDVDRWAVWQEGRGFRLRRLHEPGEGSWVVSINSRRSEVYVSDGVAPDRRLDLSGEPPVVRWPAGGGPIEFVTDVESVRLDLWEAPEWASAAGRDRYGLWASFEVDGVTQRMRWIPPGRFKMGSPETESGRFAEEGPRHWVVLTEGFWLAETPCTQELWETVMGAENPSGFVSARQPVEQVSWENCQEFLDGLNGRIRGLEVWLPTEAEWEYACRAGMDTATWRGDLGVGHAPLLAEIAWYEGDSTQEVALKHPNPWGLYDMLGNVYEWCWDLWGRYKLEVAIDPEGPDKGARRVIRGGSWSANAQYVRSAHRSGPRPGARGRGMGFRLSQGQGRGAAESEQASAVSERAGRGTSPRRRSRRSRAWVERLGWAADGGADQFGRWASFEVDSVAQRMRWIVPGRFLMGSPEDEPGRFGDEGPRHEVKLTEGFWLGETPCTQELWQAVMGENPSYFKSPSRPVEGVSWDDCQRFFKRLNERLPQLGAGLPTEAQWEYACRGGMETATWLGNLEILGDNNAPLLDEIAWYGGNSGVRFDLENGVSSSDWPKKQYPHTRAGTREVGQKHPNPWGLYDMLGNVWEWCSDYWSDAYPGGPRTDPKGPDDGAGRVFRGGSWRLHARLVRAAYRYWLHPGVRYRHLGFRLSRGQGRIE
jgi:formylglycine-generating enzyme required for sulfatase activity